MDGFCLHAQAVLFDLDGVLADSHSAIERAWLDWADAHGIGRRDALRHAMGLRSDDAVRLIAPHLDAESEAAWLEEREGQYPVIACAGAAELIEQLRLAPWAVVTSGRRQTALSRLTRLGVPLPEVLVTASDVVNGKPHPEGYLRAAETLKVASRHCVVIEDSEAGVVAAQAAGAQVIGIRGSPLKGAKVDLLISSLNELRMDIMDGAIVVVVDRELLGSRLRRQQGAPAVRPDEEA